MIGRPRKSTLFPNTTLSRPKKAGGGRFLPPAPAGSGSGLLRGRRSDLLPGAADGVLHVLPRASAAAMRIVPLAAQVALDVVEVAARVTRAADRGEAFHVGRAGLVAR